MMIGRRKFILLTASGAALFTTPGSGRASDKQVCSLLDRAEKQIGEADDKKKLHELIDTFESVLAIDPKNYQALWSLGRYNSLMALAYLTDVREKEKYYRKAISCCERGMRTNQQFDALLNNNESVPDACRVLTEKQIAALFYWYAGNVGLVNECKSRLQALWWMAKNIGGNKKIMARMMEMDPDWAGGHPYFTWAAYYSLLPRFLGGDLEKAGRHFDRAIEAGPRWLYIKYGRAVYFHTKKNDRAGFVKDLEWVAEQDPKKADSPYPADVYFQKSARKMLNNVDNYFK